MEELGVASYSTGLWRASLTLGVQRPDQCSGSHQTTNDLISTVAVDESLGNQPGAQHGSEVSNDGSDVHEPHNNLLNDDSALTFSGSFFSMAGDAQRLAVSVVVRPAL